MGKTLFQERGNRSVLTRAEVRGSLSKRQKLVVCSIILTLVLLLVQIVPENYRYYLIIFFTILSYWLSVWALSEDIKGIEWLTLFVVPTLLSLGAALFYFLLPVRWLTRLPFAFVYGISFYAIMLSENIFNVAAIRTIQLYQAALAVTSFISILIFFLFGNIIFSFRLSCLYNFLIIFVLSLIIFVPNLWNLSLENILERKTATFSFYLSLIIAEFALILSFLPLSSLVIALFLTIIFYLLLGIVQTYLSEKPIGNLYLEYALFLFIFLVVLFSGRWHG